MGKAAGAMVAAFVVGSGVMALLGTVLGVHAEAAVLGLVGVGLYASSAAMQSRVAPPPTGMAKQA
ncbi:hypothetical protein P2318_14205 [Myxococcaceae bacterium GXIMD 01537]